MKTLERSRIDAVVRELETGAYRLALDLGCEAEAAEGALLDAFAGLAPSVPRTAGMVDLRERLYARLRKRARRREWVGATTEIPAVPAGFVGESLHQRLVDLVEEHQADDPVERRRAMLGGFIGVAVIAGVVAFFWTHADALASAQPTINELSPAASANDVPLSGDVRIKFGRRPTGIPTLRVEPVHAALESVHWDGDTLVAVYTGLHISTRYQIVLQADYRSRFNDVGHYERRWQVTTRGYPVLSALEPAAGDAHAPRVGRLAIDFSYSPPATPRITVTPADGVVASGEWHGTTFTAAYSGLKPLTGYEATLTVDFGAAAAPMQRHWSFFTEPGWAPSGKPVIWYGTTNLWNLPSDQRLVAIDWQGNLAGTAYPAAIVRQQSPDGSAMTTSEGNYLDGGGVTPGMALVFPETVRIADDSSHACATVGTTSLWLETGSLRGPLRRVRALGPPQPRSSFDILACSAINDRAVIADNGDTGTRSVRVIALSSGRIVYQWSYALSGLSLVSSRDGRFLAEATAPYDPQQNQSTGTTVIRRISDGQVVARLDARRVLEFSWDGRRVVTVPFFGMPDVTLIDWQSGGVLWRHVRDQAADGQPVYVLAQPNGPAMAVALTDQLHTGAMDQLWVLSADGGATKVLSGEFYPAFGTGA